MTSSNQPTPNRSPTSTLGKTVKPRDLRQNGQFRWLLAGNVALFLAFAATILLRSLLAWQLTGDEVSLAVINMVAAFCMFGTSIFSGAVIDRVERRNLMFIGQWLIFGAESAVFFLFITGHLTFTALVLSAVVASCTFPFIMPARTAMLVDLVSRTQIAKATAWMSAGINVARMVSPALVGLIADLAGIAYGYVFLMVIHIFSQWCTYKLHHNPPHEDETRGAILSEIKHGFVYLHQNRPLALCILFGLIPIAVVIPLQNMMVVFVDHLWHQGGSGVGIMMGAIGFGGLLGSLFMTLKKEGSLVKPMLVSTLLMGGFLILLCQTPWFWLAVLVVIGIYSASVFTQTVVHTGVQLMTDDKLRGRITTMTTMSYGLAPLGTMPLAYASKHFGADWALGIAAGVMMLFALGFWYFLPSFRAIDQAVAARD